MAGGRGTVGARGAQAGAVDGRRQRGFGLTSDPAGLHLAARSLTQQQMDSPQPDPAAVRATRGPRAYLVLGGLALGLAAGAAVAPADEAYKASALEISGLIGGLWLDALKMVVIPLIVALLIIGIAKGAEAIRAGRIAARSVAWFAVVYAVSAISGVALMALLLNYFALPQSAAAALSAGMAAIDPAAVAASVPEATDFFRSIIPANVIAAASEGNVMQLVVFTALFATAASTHRSHAPPSAGDVLRGCRRCAAGGHRLGVVGRSAGRSGAVLHSWRYRRRGGLRRSHPLHRAGLDPRSGGDGAGLCHRDLRRPDRAADLRPGHDRRADDRPDHPVFAGVAPGDACRGARPWSPPAGGRHHASAGSCSVSRHRAGNEHRGCLSMSPTGSGWSRASPRSSLPPVSLRWSATARSACLARSAS